MTPSESMPKYTINVRGMVEFLLQHGDIVPGDVSYRWKGGTRGAEHGTKRRAAAAGAGIRRQRGAHVLRVSQRLSFGPGRGAGDFFAGRTQIRCAGADRFGKGVAYAHRCEPL